MQTFWQFGKLQMLQISSGMVLVVYKFYKGVEILPKILLFTKSLTWFHRPTFNLTEALIRPIST